MVNNISSGMVPDRRPAFFKIIYQGLTTHQLRIPPHFLKHISKEFSETATLKGPSGNIWNVKLTQVAGCTYIQDGWQQFFKDNCLGDNEFLLFRYDGNMSFDVQIFDKSGCERVLDASITRKHQISALPHVKSRRGRPRKNHVASLHQRPPKPFEDDCEKVKEFKEGKDMAQREIKKEESEVLIVEMDPEVMEVKEEMCARKKIDSDVPTNGKRAKLWKAAESFTSALPYFQRTLKKASVERVYILSIPFSFRMHLPPFKTKIVLQNSVGKAWVVNSVPGAGKKHFFCGGWSAFVRDNNLKKGDICIFELVDRTKMQVHIFQ
ncbi:B3 domain-containing protein Os11g0197600-like isoform X2 [Malania oleifera]|uniref:B3 domain-containing protein Os11g0197600-like isoform X2 n=1 Tax=Malania oleifera TaxID=397392 RepID=UPI0025AE0D65|nr:B3 domain-containing protein Os11g0197600-like isoform X2 [Malania oleifera]